MPRADILAGSLIRFADCEVDLAGFQLRRGGKPCALEPQVFELLAYLLRNAPRLVTRDEIIAEVWRGRIVSDAALSSRIKSARRAIGDDGEQQRYIRTVHGRGFSFIGALTPAEPPPAVAATHGADDVAPDPRRMSARGRPLIAVLPLRASGTDEVDRVLAETLTEDLVALLARDRGFDVSSRSMPLAPTCGTEPHAAGAQAGESRYLLEGRVRVQAGRLIVSARLTDEVAQTHVWAERCEQPLDARWAVDDRIARRIAAVVRGEIEGAEAARATAAPAATRGAWGHYHLGLQELYRFTQAGLSAARGHFERAVAIEPGFASALARLAYVHVQEYWYGAADGRALALALGRDAADRAIAADKKNALGHLASGRIHALRREFDLAMPAFETAIRLNPSLAQAWFALGQAQFFAGRPRDAVRLLDQAIELDPDDPHFWSFLHDQSDAFYALGQLDEAARRTKAAARHHNATHWPFASHASVLGTAGRIDEAREALAQLRARRPSYTLTAARAELAHFNDPDYVERYVEGLRISGLSDAAPPSR
jgi:DNA-binding winged helix-turn-helix (wHTH) protein/tetratricopeptide (TPR) repeat protein